MSTMDNAQAGDIAELQQLGHNFIPCSKESGEVNKSYIAWKIQKLTERLKRGKLFVHPRCENTIREFEYYRYPENKDDLNDKEEPEKVNDHCLVADTLVDTINRQTKIKDLVGKTGYLYSIDGVRKFTNVKKTGKNKKIIKLTFSNGKQVKCTEDHLFLTPDGWIKAIELENKDVIDIGSMELILLDTYATEKIYNIPRVFRKKILSLWKLLPKQWREIAQNRLGVLQWKNSSKNAYSPQGWKQIKQFNRKSRASKCCRSSKETLVKGEICCSKRNNAKKNLAKRNRVAQVRSSKRISQKNWERKLEYQNLSQKDLRVLQNGIQNPVSNEIKILLKKVSDQKLTRCKKIQSVGFADVYNLHIEGTKCFSIEGGIIVHNCMDALGDLNSFYEHFYDIKTDPFKDKIPGTYVKSYPDKIDEKEEDIEEELNIQDLW
jgi:intein/homing endonuclease